MGLIVLEMKLRLFYLNITPFMLLIHMLYLCKIVLKAELFENMFLM